MLASNEDNQQQEIVAKKMPAEGEQETKALMEPAMLQFAQKNYYLAAELFSKAVEAYVQTYGEDSIECAEPFYYYGLSLYSYTVSRNEILGDAAAPSMALELDGER